MSAAVVATGAQVNAAATSLAVPYPVGIVAGNVLICAVSSHNNSTESVNVPAGWTSIATISGSHQAPAIFYKISDGTESGNLAVVTSAATCTWHGIMTAISGLATTAPFTDSPGFAAGTSTTFTSGGIVFNANAGASGRRLALIVAQASLTTVTYSAETLASMTGVVVTELNDSNGQLVAFGTATGGASGTATGTLSASASWYVYAFDLIEDVAPSAPTPMATPTTIDPSQPLTWTWTSNDTDDGPGAQYGYDVSFSSDGGSTWPVVFSAAAGTPLASSQALTTPANTLISAGSWQWRVRTYDLAGQVGPYATSAAFTAVVPTPPNTPTVLTTPNVSDASITVVATNPPNNELPETEASFETGMTWTNSSNCTPTQSTTFALDGTHSMRMSSIAAGTMVAASVASNPVVAGAQYTAVGRFRAAVSPRSCSVSIVWRNAALGTISTSAGTAVADTTSGFTQVFCTAVAPPLATNAIILGTVASTGGAAELHYGDEFDFHAGSALAFSAAGIPTTIGVDIYRRPWNDGSAGIRIAAGLTPGATYVDHRCASSTAYQYRAVARTSVATVTAASAWAPA